MIQPPIAAAIPLEMVVAEEGTVVQTDPGIEITWTGPNVQVAGYNVYRAQTQGTQTKPPINGSVLIKASPYLDPGVVPGKTYYYVVTAVGMNGAESKFSAETPGVTVIQ